MSERYAIDEKAPLEKAASKSAMVGSLKNADDPFVRLTRRFTALNAKLPQLAPSAFN